MTVNKNKTLHFKKKSKSFLRRFAIGDYIIVILIYLLCIWNDRQNSKTTTSKVAYKKMDTWRDCGGTGCGSRVLCVCVCVCVCVCASVRACLRDCDCVRLFELERAGHKMRRNESNRPARKRDSLNSDQISMALQQTTVGESIGFVLSSN